MGLSGGVDSSVAAWILKEQGYEVTALFMRNWNDTTGLLQSSCHWEDDYLFAEMAGRKIGIPVHLVDLSDQYHEKVIDYMFSEYENGRTPNPDILCNREIKFDSFVQEAEKKGADYIATGHYCRKEEAVTDGRTYYRLLAGKDKNKDQSYFLCQISQNQLARILFPVGNLTKPEVRSLAVKLGLPTASRKDSQGICFVGKVHLPTFLQQKLKARKGDIVLIPSDLDFKPNIGYGQTENDLTLLSMPYHYSRESGKVIGTHDGAHFFTIGQRKGIKTGGFREPLFVIATDVKENIVYVGEGKMHPGLYRKGLFVKSREIHWIRPDLEMRTGESREYMVRIRYRQPLQPATLFRKTEGIYIIFKTPQRGITPGQFAAWYDGEELLGSGVIDR
ncbi:MAG: tRNA 2-thiouridine(34) synthase MnmA [Bacteroidales bacterium]|nr:tRNA 2-thiouridine(34) synthase MnmA [Bacteroidales bacterium]